MEVNNQMMDQLLVTGAAQPGASQNAKAPKEADTQDFNSMVHQKRATGKSDTKDAKAADVGKAEKPAADNAQDGEPITGEQYAIAAALMMQAQPDGARLAQIHPEMVAAENVVTVEAVLNEEPQLTVEANAQSGEPQMTVETVAQPEQAAQDTPVDTAAQPMQTPKARTENTEAKVETAPERKTSEPEQTAQPMREDAPRAEKADTQVRFVRNDAKPEAETDDTAENTQTAQAAPLFQNVEAPVVKVAEVARPVPLAAENGVEQLASEIDSIVVNDVSANRIEVTLTPENLGKLTVEITRGENGNLSIVLHTTSERAANLLEKNTANLQQALTSSSRENVDVQVRPSEESQQQFLNPDGQNQQERQQQQQQRRGDRQDGQQNAQDFLQQLRLGLVDNKNEK